MKLKLLTAVAALVASVPASAGELDGRALICIPDFEPRPIGFEFRDGRAIGWNVVSIESKAVIEEFGPGEKYETTSTSADWWGLDWYLDRKTLRLNYIFRSKESPAVYKYQCDVAASLNSFRETLEEARANFQSELDERRKGNKI